MNQNDLEHLKKWFADYVAGFYTDSPTNNSTIRIKEKHTERVCENMILLGKALDLSDEEMVLTETMALFLFTTNSVCFERRTVCSFSGFKNIKRL